MEEYKTLSRTHNTKLGGLGANFNEDWESKAKKNEKTKEFSNMIRGINSEKISKQISLRNDGNPKQSEAIQKQPEDKAALAREKALAFAKSIPKPKQRKREGFSDQTEVPNEGFAPPGHLGGNLSTQNGKKSTKPEKKLDEEINKVEDDLEALERQHLFYQEKINKLKS